MVSRPIFRETSQRNTISRFLNARRAKTPRPLMFDDPITMSLFMCRLRQKNETLRRFSEQRLLAFIYLRLVFTMSAKRDARSSLLIESAHFQAVS